MPHLAQYARFALATAALVSAAATANASGFADPPPGSGEPILVEPEPERDHYHPHRYEPREPWYAPRSALRLSVGPAARFADAETRGGLYSAIDIGEGAAGLRLSGTWVSAAAGSVQQYGGELWVDFGEGQRLHPILGAGAGLALLDRELQDGTTETSSIGVGVLRGTLQYALPVGDTDARAGLDVIGSLPAIRGQDDPDPGAWVTVTASVIVGF